MHQHARKEDFDNLHVNQQERMIALLYTLLSQQLACRFEMVGTDMVVTIGQGLASPRFWIDKFDLNLDLPR